MSSYKTVAYIRAKELPENPDMTGITHVNYAFAFTSEDAITVDDPEALKKIRAVTKKAGVKLLVSLQQQRGIFCKRAKTAEGRALFARQCAELKKQYDLDGIDLDWEYPGIDIRTNSTNCDTCENDFIDLLAAMREALGAALLTFASPSTPDTWKHVDFKRAGMYLDFMNVMGYDYNWAVLGSGHQSNLFPGSEGLGNHAQCGDLAVTHILNSGFPAEKIILGVPFYGYVAGKGAAGFVTYQGVKDFLASGECTYAFDEAAKQSYLMKDGAFYVAYDCPRTMEIKGAYVKEKSLGGMMYWTYNQDDREGTLRRAVYAALNE